MRVLKKLGMDIWYIFVGTVVSCVWFGIPLAILSTHYGFKDSPTYQAWVNACDILLLPLIVAGLHAIGRHVCGWVYRYFTEVQ